MMNKSSMRLCACICGVKLLLLAFLFYIITPGIYFKGLKTNSHQASKVRTGERKSPTDLKVTNERKTLQTVIQKYNVSTLSSKGRRASFEQQLRDTIRIHHERNFLQPKYETCTKRFPVCILVGVKNVVQESL